MPAARPISDAEATDLLQPLCGLHLLLAVSGGADSMALMHLVARWLATAAGRSPAVHVATVDHALRSESASEAAWVAHQAATVALPHTILKWSTPKPATAIQEHARTARYGLLSNRLHQLYPNLPAALVTAHHLDDQAETVLMRLARGSGIDGLAAMTAASHHHGALLLRPLLSVPKARLIATLRAANLAWIEDPSNQRGDYERVRIRKAWPELAKIGLTPASLARTAGRMNRARRSIERATRQFMADAVDLHRGLYAEVSRSDLLAAGSETAVRTLAHLVSTFGGAHKPARLTKVEALLDELRASAGKPLQHVQRTLAGTLILAASDAKICIWREPGRHPLPIHKLQDNEPLVWDERFRIALRGTIATPGSLPLEVRALGPRGLTILKTLIDRPTLRSSPHAACLTLPAIWQGDTLRAVPYFASMLPHQIVSPTDMAHPTAYQPLAKGTYSAEFLAQTASFSSPEPLDWHDS